MPSIHHVEQGSGEPVVLLHSSASSSAQWRSLMQQLMPDYRLIAPDLHGYGATAHWAGHGPFRLEHEARIVLSLAERCDNPIHLVGHSFGGAVALHVARTRPDLLASLTLIEPVAFHLLSGVDGDALSEICAVAAAVRGGLVCGDYFGGTAAFVDYWSGPGAWNGLPEERRSALSSRLVKVALDFEATFNEPATLADFATVLLPTLILQGTASPRPTRRICELLAGVLPDARLAKVEGAGHMAPLTHRDAVNHLIAAHLEASLAVH